MSLFDRFADAASRVVARSRFFVACVLLVAIWLPSLPAWPSADTWQLVINTITTIITFLLVALLQNTQQRFEDVTNMKLNALISHALGERGADRNLRVAIGSEKEVGSTS